MKQYLCSIFNCYFLIIGTHIFCLNCDNLILLSLSEYQKPQGKQMIWQRMHVPYFARGSNGQLVQQVIRYHLNSAIIYFVNFKGFPWHLQQQYCDMYRNVKYILSQEHTTRVDDPHTTPNSTNIHNYLFIYFVLETMKNEL